MGSKKDSCGHFLELFISIVLGILYEHIYSLDSVI